MVKLYKGQRYFDSDQDSFAPIPTTKDDDDEEEIKQPKITTHTIECKAPPTVPPSPNDSQRSQLLQPPEVKAPPGKVREATPKSKQNSLSTPK